jgi:colicin import membrane protein
LYSHETMSPSDSIKHRCLALGLNKALLLLPFVACAAAFAQAATQPPLDVRQVRKERLEALREQTHSVRKAAEADFKVDLAECQKRILVNDCISQAKQRRLVRVEEARKLEAEESAIEREIKRAELAERRARKAQTLSNRPPPEITTSPEGPEEVPAAK